MAKLKHLSALLHLLFIFSLNTFGQTSASYGFSFSLPSDARTSAGVFKKDGTLIRTLWNAVKYTPGSYRKYWDGKDDNGKLISYDSTLKIHLLSNNITSKWGVIGNTSFTSSGTSYHGYMNFFGMAITGTTAYVALGYNEGSSTKIKFDISNPQIKTGDILPSGQGTAQETHFVATDGTLVYWAEVDPFDRAKWWVHATNVSDDAQHIFANGIAFNPTSSIHYKSILDFNTANYQISGLAVNSRFIFVSHSSLNKIHVFDKTGLLIQKLSLPDPKAICADGSSLWVASGTHGVAKYTVNSNGTLSKATVTLTGLVAPYALQASGNSILVVDGGARQQVRFFNKSTGAEAAPLGQLGGYTTDATVANNKFMFIQADSYTQQHDGRSYIALQPDGSFWVGDYGNMRNQHFSSTKTFINNIAYTGNTRIAGTDPNNPTRVFNGLLEFKRDYSKPLAADNGSWILFKNWRGGLPSDYTKQMVNGAEVYPEVYYLRFISTLSNGRTYGFLRNPYSINKLEGFELMNKGILRSTGVYIDIYSQMGKDGCVYSVNSSGTITENYTAIYTKRLLAFNASNNPVWGTPVEIERITPVATDPIYRGNMMEANQVTSTGVRVTYNEYLDNGYHLGGIKNGKWVWKTAKSTHTSYIGDFPGDGYYDIGNTVANGHAGAEALAIDKLIFQGYHGEFWKQGQVNMHNIFYDNGLLLRQIGTCRSQYKLGAPQMAGNAIAATLVKVGNDYYLHHCDESYNGGVHEFKISNVSSVQEQIIDIQKSETSVSPAPPLGYVDLMAGLPFDSVVTTRTAGWSRYPAGELVDQAQVYTNQWSVTTSKYSYRRDLGYGGDMFIKYTQSTAGNNFYVTRDLGSNTNLTSWAVTGRILISGISVGINGVSKTFQILDGTGRVIAIFDYSTYDFRNSGYHILGNGTDIHKESDWATADSIVRKLRDISISGDSGRITFSYAGFTPITVPVYDKSACWNNPKYLKVKFNNGDGQIGLDQIIDLKDMRFYTQKSISNRSAASASVSDSATEIIQNNHAVDSAAAKSRSGKEDVKVYPNPISGNSLIIKFHNIPEGIYSVSLSAIIGVTVFAGQIIHSGSQASHAISVSSTIPYGVYNLKISGNGRTFYKQVLK